MSNIFAHTIIFAASLFLWASCGNKHQINEEQPIVTDTLSEQLLHSNKRISAKERLDIDNFVRRKQWPMTETGTGLRYSVYSEGKGRQVVSGDLVSVEFEISLLNGKICYSSEETGAEQFVVDHDHVESGLHEAIKYLRVGDKAKIIIPSHLAFGLTGDSDQIPPLSPVVYDLTVVDAIAKRPNKK